MLIGHSMGGAVALELALRQSSWLHGMVLTCSGARYPVPARLMHLLHTDFKSAIDLIIAESFEANEGPLTYRQKAMRNGTHRQMLRSPQKVVLGDYEACIAFDVTDRLAEIKLPTLIAAGGHDRITPPHLSRELHQGISGSRLVLFQNAGHMLPMERPDDFNSLVKEFKIWT